MSLPLLATWRLCGCWCRRAATTPTLPTIEPTRPYSRLDGFPEWQHKDCADAGAGVRRRRQHCRQRGSYSRLPAQNGHTETVRAMVRDFLADPNTINDHGRTPVWIAAQNGHTETGAGAGAGVRRKRQYSRLDGCHSRLHCCREKSQGDCAGAAARVRRQRQPT